MKKEYPLPEEICHIADLKLGCQQVRDLAVKLPFGYWKAKKAAAETYKYHRLLWTMIYDIYPELTGVNAHYDAIKQAVIVDEEEGE